MSDDRSDTNDSDDIFADTAPAAPADKPRRKRGNQPPDTRPEIYEIGRAHV